MQRERLLLSYDGHDDVVNALSWSPNSKYIASASNDGTVQIWDATTGEQVVSYHGHNGPVEVVVWSPDGKEIASGGWDKTIQVWQAMTGETVCVYRGHESVVMTLSWSPDGVYIASGGGCMTPIVQVWDVSTQETVSIYNDYLFSIRAASWAPDGQTIALGGFHENIRRWDPFTKEVVMTYDYWLSGAFTSKGQRVATRDYVRGNVVWSPDGLFLATGVEPGGISIWNAKTGENITVFAGYSHAVAWSLDGARIASAASFKDGVAVWQMR